ncbi:MAG: hypothetical protein HY823_12235 [Acidobacteria bacterium]|nr:hypothetical protein [Acidobacteriota bacterium]
MVDSSWDNAGLPAPKKGLGTGAKVAIGCGVVLLLVVGSCAVAAGVGATVVGRQMEAREWPALRKAVDQLRTEAGAAELYRQNPRLARDHPTEEAFLAAAESWRPRLEPLPEKAPSVFTGRISMTIEASGGFRNVELGYRNDRGTRIDSQWENGQLVMIRVQ